MAKWPFYVLVFAYMCYRAVYGATASISVDQITYGDKGYLEVGSKKTINCKGSIRNQKLEWIDPFGDVIKKIPSRRMFAQEHFISSPKGGRSPGLVLTLNDLLVGDSGVYQCKSGALKKSVPVCVISPAVFVDTSPEITTETGRAITLSCQAKGDPEPRLMWVRDGEELFDGVEHPKYRVNRKYNSQGYESLLTVISLEPEDKGLYSCVSIQESPMLDNCSHYDIMNVTLKVNHAPLFKHGNDTKLVYGKTNEVVVLTCAASAWPKPTYRWFEDQGGSLLYEFDKTKIKYSEEANSAALSVTAGPKTFGMSYKCQASNKYGNTDKYFKLLERETPRRAEIVANGHATDSQIFINVTWDDEIYFPVDGFDIQYIETSKVRSKSPTPAEWKRARLSRLDIDEDDLNEEGAVVMVEGLTPETEYFVRVRATNEAGEAPWSDTEQLWTSSESATEEPEEESEDDDKSPDAKELASDNGTFYGIFFAGAIAITLVVCMFVMRIV